MNIDNAQKSTASLAIIGVFAASILVVPASADELDGPAGAAPEETPIQEADSGRDGWLDTIAVLGGISVQGSDTGITAGFEVERALSDSFGIGALVEYAAGDLESLMIAVPFTYRLNSWKFQIAPGYVDANRGGDFVTRFGTGYDFNVGNWMVTPNVKADVLAADDSRAILVYGVSFSTGF